VQPYYEILGIADDASQEDIQAAYDALLKQCYTNLRDPKTHDEYIEKIKQIKLAGNCLLNEELRKKYDMAAQMQEIEQSAPPNPWWRLFARCIDLLLFAAVCYPIYQYLANYVFFEDWTLALEAAAVGIALYILLETAFVTIVGSTLGKWMLSIKVTAVNGEKVRRLLLMKRNLMVALFGFGLYIPPVPFVTLALQYRKLKKPESEGRPSWDRACGTAVRYAEIKAYRMLLIIPILILVIVDLVNAF
jgi:uncharacterized RDD family membrane protein YckC